MRLPCQIGDYREAYATRARASYNRHDYQITTAVAAVATIKPLTNHVYICQGLRPLSSSSRVKWRHVRMSMMMANTQAVVHVNATATI
jgi:hypothetical protein